MSSFLSFRMLYQNQLASFILCLTVQKNVVKIMLLYIDVQTPFFFYCLISAKVYDEYMAWKHSLSPLKSYHSFKYLVLKKNVSSLSWHLPIQPSFWFSSLAPRILLRFQNLYFLPGLIILFTFAVSFTKWKYLCPLSFAVSFSAFLHISLVCCLSKWFSFFRRADLSLPAFLPVS